MRANKKSIKPVWSDADDAPDLSTPKWKAKLAAAPVKRGRPKAVDTKLSTTIRIDRDVLSAFKKGGPRSGRRGLTRPCVIGLRPAKLSPSAGKPSDRIIQGLICSSLALGDLDMLAPHLGKTICHV